MCVSVCVCICIVRIPSGIPDFIVFIILNTYMYTNTCVYTHTQKRLYLNPWNQGLKLESLLLYTPSPSISLIPDLSVSTSQPQQDLPTPAPPSPADPNSSQLQLCKYPSQANLVFSPDSPCRRLFVESILFPKDATRSGGEDWRQQKPPQVHMALQSNFVGGTSYKKKG